ncbi:protein rolling stone isoform X3 [Eurosta solidaginis]|uniref:protein rolling stone isoform X3 n=1 Tax=Eurosta solidaginis TaxID=178769 RepID=UPI0035313257
MRTCSLVWQCRTKSVAYLIYRWLIALFFIAIVIDSMLETEEGSSTNFWLYFIYMTNWGVMLCMFTNILGAVLVTLWHFHPEYADKLLNLDSLTSPFVIYWGMHIISLVLSIVITIIYWSVLYDAAESSLNATNVLTHACNSIFMFIDLLIVAHPLRLLHIFLPVLFGSIFAIFSIIYHLCGGKNKKGQPYIYHVIDWNEPLSATLVVFGVVLLSCCIYMMLFTIYKLRIMVYRHVHKASYYLPTTTPNTSGIEKTENADLSKTVRGNGIQHSPSGISMVLGNFNTTTGYQNEAFTASSENISAGLRCNSEYAKIRGNLQLNADSCVICQGYKVIYNQYALEYGTKLVGCISLKKGGTTHLGLPVFASVARAKKATDRHATVIYVAPPGAAAAILEALEAEMSDCLQHQRCAIT